MYWNKRLKAAKAGYTVLSVLLCLLGIFLIVKPDFSIVLLCRIMGGIMLLFGTVKIIGYCSRDLYRLAFQYDLAFGILLMAIGAILILRTDMMIHLVCILMGVCVLADALLKVQIALDAKDFGIRWWWLIFAVAILTGVVGFVLVIRPSESTAVIMVLLGVSLLAEGLLNLITVLTAVQAKHRELE